jgi:cell division initiation protein
MSQRLTPIDILNLRFHRGLGGYSVAEVDDFVRRAAADMEAILTENAAQKDKIVALERELAQFRSIETTLRDALVLAQKAADETRAAAHAQAEATLHAAQARAHDMNADMLSKVEAMTGQLEALRQERRRLARDLRAQLTSQLLWLAEEFETKETEEPVAAAANPALENA